MIITNRVRRNLLASASVSTMVLLAASTAHAGTVTVNGTETAPAVNARIQADADTDLTLEVTQTGEVVGNTDVRIEPDFFGTANSEAITVTNDGEIGQVNATGAVTDSAGLSLSGASSDPANTLTLTSNGLVAGGIDAFGFGGTTSITNAGTVYGQGISVTGGGDVIIDSSAGAVREGDVTSQVLLDLSQTGSAFNPGGLTRTTTSGDTTVSVGDVASADGAVRGDVDIDGGMGETSLTVGGTVGDVDVVTNTNIAVATTSLGIAQAGQTVVTQDTTFTEGSADIDFTLTGGGSVDNLSLRNDGAGDVSADISGTVGESGNGSMQITAIGSNTTELTTETQDAAGNTTETTRLTTETNASGDVNLTVDGELDLSDLTVNGGGDVNIDVTGSIELNNFSTIAAQRTLTTRRNEETVSDPATGSMGSATEETIEAVGGDVTISVADTGSLDTGGLFVSAARDVVFMNEGTVDNNGSLQLSAIRFVSENEAAQSDTVSVDAAGVITSTNQSAQSNITNREGSTASLVNAGDMNGPGGIIMRASDEISIVNSGDIDSLILANATLTNVASNETNQLVVTSDPATTIETRLTELATTNQSNAIRGEMNVINDAGGQMAGLLINSFGDMSVQNDGSMGTVLARTAGEDVNTASTTVRNETTDLATGDFTSSDEFDQVTTRSSTDSDIDFTNGASGIIDGFANLTATGDITINNEGLVLQGTIARTQGRDEVRTTDSSSTSSQTTDAMTGIVVDRIDDNTVTSAQTIQTGGDIDGNYSGLNGSANFVGGNGNVSQTAQGNSTANVSGAIYGDLTVSAGVGDDTTLNDTILFTDISDSNGDGSTTRSASATEVVDNTGAEVADVTITGLVAAGQGSGGNVTLNSVGDSFLSLSGGIIEGDINITSQALRETSVELESLVQSSEAFTTVTDSLTVSASRTVQFEGGGVTVDIGNGSSVGGDVNVTAGAGDNFTEVSVSSDSEVGGDVFVMSGDVETFGMSTDQSYTRDSATGAVETSQITRGTSTAPQNGGNVIVFVDGEVGGDAETRANSGDALTRVTGVVGGDANAYANARNEFQEQREVGEGTAPIGSSATDFATLVSQPGINITRTESLTRITSVGGSAEVVIEADAAVTAANLASADEVTAEGFAGAAVRISNGSTITGDLEAISTGFDGEEIETDDFEMGVLDQTIRQNFSEYLGGDALAGNDGRVEGNVTVVGASSSSFVNNGLVGLLGLGTNVNQVRVGNIGVGTDFLFSDVDQIDPTLRTQRTLVIRTGTETTSSVTNNGVIEGNLIVAATDGTVVNNGYILGQTTLGQSVDNYVSEEIRTAATTTFDLSVNSRLTQNYTFDQNALSGGINVTGATTNVLNPVTGEFETLQTSDVNAVINLNDSVTLGNITAERDSDNNDAALTNTVVNLNGEGSWGLDFIGTGNNVPGADRPAPFAEPDQAGLSIFANGTTNLSLVPTAIRGLGLTEVNKNGNGTFVIVGAAYQAPTAVGATALWTLDVADFNINEGEVQLSLSDLGLGQAAGLLSEFGIRGNVNNDATLVIGRRVIPGGIPALNGGAAQSSLISGINLLVQGNYNQSATGMTVVGIDGSLVRQFGAGTFGGGSGSTSLAPVNVFTDTSLFVATDQSNVAQNRPSFVNVDGDLNLDGTIMVNVNPNTLYLDGDGQTIFAYTGNGAIGATASTSMATNFLNFDVVHDTAAQTVSVVANRTGFETAATNDNAAAAATAFNSAFASALTDIRADNFASLQEAALAQDVANIAAGLDYNLTMAQAAEVFDELSGGEVHGSLSAVDQAMVVRLGHDVAKRSLLAGKESKSRVYITPFARSGDIGGGSNFGASDLDTDTYGAAFGMDFAYSDKGLFGLAFGYGEHDVEAIGSNETADIESFSVAAYGSHRFNRFYGSFDMAYTASTVETERKLDLLARTIQGEYDARQIDGSAEIGYVFDDAGNWMLAPYARIEAREWKTDAFTETDGQGVSLLVDEAKETVFSPVIGGQASTSFSAGAFEISPYADLSYTLQGDINGDRSVRYAAGGNSFTLKGVNPDDFGRVDGGVNMKVSEIFDIFAGISQTFGGSYDVTSVRGGAGFKF